MRKQRKLKSSNCNSRKKARQVQFVIHKMSLCYIQIRNERRRMREFSEKRDCTKRQTVNKAKCKLFKMLTLPNGNSLIRIMRNIYSNESILRMLRREPNKRKSAIEYLSDFTAIKKVTRLQTFSFQKNVEFENFNLQGEQRDVNKTFFISRNIEGNWYNNTNVSHKS